MRVLIFDTETTGLIPKKKINQDMLHLCPHIVQFSYLIFNTETNMIEKMNDSIVKVPNGIIIPEDSVKIHGITNEISQTGKPIQLILENFFKELKTVDMVVGHNISFDIDMVLIETMRFISQDNSFQLLYKFKNIYCTMNESIHLCNIVKINKSGNPYVKFPKLSELHEKLFGTVPNNLHNSMNDVLVTLRCFMKIKLDTDLLETCNHYKEISQSNQIL